MPSTSPARFVGKFMLVVLMFGVLGLILLPSFSRAREASRRASCQNNLKQMGLVFVMYAAETRGSVFPALSPIPDNWVPDPAAIYPEYMSDPSVLQCPDNPLESLGPQRGGAPPKPADCIASTSYIYTGKAIYCDEQAIALFNASANWAVVATNTDSLPLDVPVWPDSDRVEDADNSGIPIMWDRIAPNSATAAHTPLGMNVLHFDGHVKFVKYSPYNNSNFFPCTRVSAETFGSVYPRLPDTCY